MTLPVHTITLSEFRPPTTHVRLLDPPSAARQACDAARAEWERRHQQIAQRVRQQSGAQVHVKA
jgi:hypothetical protein